MKYLEFIADLLHKFSAKYCLVMFFLNIEFRMEIFLEYVMDALFLDTLEASRNIYKELLKRLPTSPAISPFELYRMASIIR